MIELFSGTPGSGKSLHLARMVRDALKFSCPVIGTFHINKECLWKHSKYPYTYVNIYDLSPKFLLDYYNENKDKYLRKGVENSFLLVIDECQRIFNSREWQANKDRKDWITFFSEHRHYGFNIVVVSQMDIMIDRQIRGLIEYEYLHRKVDNFGIAGHFIKLFLGNFVVIKQWRALKNYNMGSEFIRGNKKLFNFYNTFEDFAFVGRGEVQETCPDNECEYLEKLKKIDSISA